MSAADAPRVRSASGEDLLDSGERNRFFIWHAGEPAAVEFRPQEMLEGAGATDLRYFYGLTLELDRGLPNGGITFLLTWNLDAFEERFRDAVVILVGDEKYQTPSYAGEVRAIFKTGGTQANPPRTILKLAPAIAWRVMLRELRNSLLTRRRHGARAPSPAPMFELPMGYFGLTDVSWVPFVERPVDVFFAGSIEADGGFTVRPRLAARRQMTAALTVAREQLPDLRADCTSSGPFANPQDMLDSDTYSGRLMRAKIALCPRGNFDETFRLVEAAKSGCVAIAERLPERWYNRDSPAIQIDRWSSLPAVLQGLLSDTDALARRSEQMRRWWTDSLSERASGDFVLTTLPQVWK
jgi:hypothetical protein